MSYVTKVFFESKQIMQLCLLLLSYVKDQSYVALFLSKDQTKSVCWARFIHAVM